jgi:hypothetical protein
MRNTGAFSAIRLPGLTMRCATTPSIGAVMLVYDSSSLASS